MAVYNSIIDAIGNTPLLKLDSNKTGLKNIELYAKLEYMNPFGSLKDRTALGMLKDDIENIAQNGQEFIEASSGNTIKAMQSIAGIYGVKSTSVTNRIRVPEIRDILLTLGVNIVEVPGKSSCIDPTNPEDPLYIIANMMNENKDKYIYPNQYYNEKNPQIHEDTTGREITDDIGNVDYLFATLGTTGSSQGVFKRLKKDNSNLKAIGVAAARDDYIPGIRNQNDLMDVGIYDKSIYDDTIYETSSNSIDGMLDLIRNHGVLAGPTSGAVYSVALKKLKELDNSLNKKVKAVVILCDRMEWYMSYLKERKPEIFKLEAKPDSIKNYAFSEDDLEEVTNNSIQEFIEDKQIMIIDIRSNLAYRMGHIPGSINITDSFLEEIIDNRYPFPKETRLIITCARGNSSKRIAAYLRKQGYYSSSLKDGILGLKNLNFELEAFQTN